MKLFGGVTYTWRGQERRAFACGGSDIRIHLRDEWVTVARIGGGTELVPWTDIRCLRGWSAIAARPRERNDEETDR